MDAVLREIVQGTLSSVEREVEVAIGRTARSPMIRDAHDYRVGIHDRRLRKLTGRSYSALVQPVVRDFPLASMRPGDVFFHNDVYLSEGGIGHLPDLCVTVPVFSDGRVVAFVQAFGHHDDIGGAVPGSMPSHARSVFEEGLMVPPIRLWDAGMRNDAAVRIMTRNSRMPDSLAADLDAECAACRMGADRLADLFARYGVDEVEACFDAIVDATTQTFRREILAKIPDGSYVWEDYAEHDGVDSPKLHAQRITMTKRPDKLVLDFTGTSPQAKGPINHCADYADGNFLAKWLAPVLRNLADTPERMAELDVNEGVVPLLEMVFPPPGTLLTPIFPAPTNARTFVILRLLGVFAGVLAKAVDGRMPADQETIRYTGVYGLDAAGEAYLMREVLGGGSGGRYYADGEDTIHVVPDSRNIPVEFAESRWPLRVERLGLAVDSGGPGRFRGGLGYEKHVRVLRDASFMSIADRSILSCWGVAGGRAGRPFSVTVDPGGPRERPLDALVDDAPVRAGEVVRIRTTGGGGWGDPLERDVARVLADVRDGKVSVPGAATDYGVVVGGSAAETAALRARRGRAVLRPRPRLRDVVRRRGLRGRRPAMSSGRPLDGVVVIDLTRALAGPHAAMMLGDLGARVIKVESPAGGDDSRGWGPPFVGPPDARESTYFLSANRNKESVVLDLKSAAGADTLRRLARAGDVLIENFRPGVLDRLGLGFDALTQLNPRLVILSITGFGHDGPEGGRAGYDQIAQGEGGLMSLTGTDAAHPMRVGVPISDLLAGMYGAYGAVAALYERERTGRGGVVRTSLLAASVGVHAFQGTRYTVAGEVPEPQGNHHPSIAPYGMFAAADGFLQLSVASENLWRVFAPLVGLRVDDPRFATNDLRVRARAELAGLVEAAFAARPVAHWLDVLAGAGIPAGRVRTLDEVYGWEQARSQGLLVDVEHPTLGRIELPGPPLRFDGAAPAGHAPPPRLGEHTDAVLAWLDSVQAPR